MEKLYSAENGVVREFTEAEYTQHQIDQQEYLISILPIQIREKRNGLLVNCDWTQTLDSPLNAEQKTAWTTYRQALRDITTQSGFPTDVTWPSAPN